jgi:hypothetical protein
MLYKRDWVLQDGGIKEKHSKLTNINIHNFDFLVLRHHLPQIEMFPEGKYRDVIRHITKQCTLARFDVPGFSSALTWAMESYHKENRIKKCPPGL